MKKKLEAELISIAHRILQLKNKADIHELKQITGVLHEKLSVLSFAEKHFAGAQPTIGKKQIENALTEKEMPSLEKKSEKKPEEKARPDGTQHNTEAITEPNTEIIKNIVSEMPSETEETDKFSAEKPTDESTDSLKNFGVHFDELPQFEPVSEKKEEKKSTKNQPEASKTEKPDIDVDELHRKNGMAEFEPKEKHKKNEVSGQKKSLNDRLKKGINIGLNDRLAYIKHLFGGNAADYNRVLSQLNTIETYEEAHRFVQEQIKPDYNNWENKEEYETRFIRAIENKFE